MDANYVATATPFHFTVGLGSGKEQYTWSTVDFGGIYGDDGFLILVKFLFGIVDVAVGGFIDKILICGVIAIFENLSGDFCAVGNI